MIAADALDEYYMFQEMNEVEEEYFEDDDIFEEDEDSGNGRFLS
jgi:hypothetical protein